MSQFSFAFLYQKKKITSTETFLNEMGQVTPRSKLTSIIQTHYYNGKTCKMPMKLVLMLRIYFLQEWFNLGNPTAEKAVYDRISFQKFLRIEGTTTKTVV